jgi:histidine ammonia-lyase
MSEHLISSDFLSLKRIKEILKNKEQLALSESAREKIESCRNYLNDKVERSEVPIYGINTGFGSLCDTEVSKSDLERLQRNLVTSHACGMGDEVPESIVQLMLLLKVQGLSQGHSGVQLRTVQRLIDFYNKGVFPIVYQQGSLGASGDLAPLAHLCLPLLGEGEVRYKGERYSGGAILEKMGWEAITLQSKEGLALLNGTQFMSAYATHCLLELERLSNWSDLIAATSLDAFDGRIEAFDPLVHEVRPHSGQKQTAATILEYLQGSGIVQRKKQHVQDPYCIRCVPQVHGASKDAIAYAQKVLETEINAVTDNPTIFEEDDKVISAGNFHGQPLALILDFLAIATAELASISERRTYKLISGQRGLPPFLVNKAGLNSGFMIAQYAAASAVSQNKQLATPASVDTIDSSNGQEDHVSMGANAATKLKRVVDNLEKIMGIEWFTACQALDFREEKSSDVIEAKKELFRKEVPFLEEDTTMYPLIEKSIQFLRK